jgi:hypothetical protein
MTIGNAVKKALKVGGTIRRAKWKQYYKNVAIQPDEPTCWLYHEDKDRPPTPGWEPGIDDLTANDWYVSTH